MCMRREKSKSSTPEAVSASSNPNIYRTTKYSPLPSGVVRHLSYTQEKDNSKTYGDSKQTFFLVRFLQEKSR